MSDSGIFDKAIQLLLLDFPTLSDPEFLKDHAELAGIVPGKTPPPQPVAGPGPKLQRPIAAAGIRNAMEILETTLLADVAAKAKVSPAREVKGDEAASTIFNSGYAETEGVVDEEEAVVTVQGLEKGDLANVYPTDNGSLHKDMGVLVSLDSKEVVS
ncbi:hypothetical protein TWF506_010548 [Arthrobotrys conoides]|uniref:Uncharacterized protein n=1 Tax=Arthrobotrys conoides TaxID=74498 RepID=A0AAN8RL08_9PEZI